MDIIKKVKVTMFFKANIAAAAGADQTEFMISPDVKQAIDDIRGYFSGRNIQGLLYTVFINGATYDKALKEGYTIKEGDEITIIPTILGG